MVNTTSEYTPDVHSIEIDTAEDLRVNYPTHFGEGRYCPDIRVRMSVGHDDSEVTVIFDFLDTGNDFEGIVQYDVDMSASNNDWAGLEDQLEAMKRAVEKFRAMGFHREILGKKIEVVGMPD